MRSSKGRNRPGVGPPASTRARCSMTCSKAEDERLVESAEVGNLVGGAGEEPVRAGAAGRGIAGGVVEDRLALAAVQQEVVAIEPAQKADAAALVRQVGDSGIEVVAGSPLVHDGAQGGLVAVVEGGAADEDVVAAVADHAVGAAAANHQVAAAATDEQVVA